jgi:CelD/BcsL family acetyltransferase involved in cellulose biosynthesis
MPMLLQRDKQAPTSIPCGPYETQLIESLAELRALEPEWRQFLAGGVSGSNFFNDPIHVALHLELEPQLAPLIVVLRRDGRIHCIAPFFVHDRRLRIEFSVIKLAAPRVPTLTVCGGQFILAHIADAECCFQAIFEYLWSRRTKLGLVYLEYLPLATSLWQYCHTSSVGRSKFGVFLASSRIDTIHQIDFPATYDEFLKTLSYDTRRKLRRYTRRLQESAQLRLERIDEPDQVPRFLDHVDQIFRDTWQAIANGYYPRNTTPYVRYISQISRAGFLRSYVLTNNDDPIAFALGYQYDGVYYFLETGYTQAWADFGPGIVLMHLFFEDLCSHDKPQLLDFIGGDQPYKRSFSTSQRSAASIYLAPPNRWRLVLRGQQILNFLSRCSVRGLTALRLDRAFRKLFMVHH